MAWDKFILGLIMFVINAAVQRPQSECREPVFYLFLFYMCVITSVSVITSFKHKAVVKPTVLKPRYLVAILSWYRSLRNDQQVV